MSAFAEPARVLAAAVAGGAFPAAVAEVGRRDRVLWTGPFGHLSTEPDAAETTLESVFDLASLTKVVTTTTLAMRAVDDGSLALDSPLREHFRAWQTDDRREVTVRDLLEHASGLTPHLPFFRDHHSRVKFEEAICRLPLEYEPRQRSHYSDLGFILLGFLVADTLGAALDTLFERLVGANAWGDIAYRPPSDWRPRTAPTEVGPWRGRLLIGEVHDENAWALGGVAGHAGLFGTAAAVGRFARVMLGGLAGDRSLASESTMRTFLTRSDVPGSSRALGWDTMMTTSSCGTGMSSAAFGHTGFTGTSLWIDPDSDVYVVLLTNRVYPTRTNDAILAVRPAFHDAVMTAVRAIG